MSLPLNQNRNKTEPKQNQNRTKSKNGGTSFDAVRSGSRFAASAAVAVVTRLSVGPSASPQSIHSSSSAVGSSPHRCGKSGSVVLVWALTYLEGRDGGGASECK